MVKTNTAETQLEDGLVTPLSLVMDEAIQKGFDLIFRIKEDGSLWDQSGLFYDMKNMKITYSRVFNDGSEEGHTTKMYLLSNEEGDRGILVDAEGIYEDARISTLIKSLESVHQEMEVMEHQLKPKNRLLIAAAGLLLVGSAVVFKIIGRKR